MMQLFPFSTIRSSQKDFMDDVRSCIENKQHLIANAPTGLGKTAATLAPAVEYALDNGKTVFFLTPRHTQHQIAVETLKKMRAKRPFYSADLIGKKWLCAVLGIDELNGSDFNEYCKAVTKDERCQYFNRTRTKDHVFTKEAKEELKKLELLQPFHAEEAKSDTFCGYEFVIDIAKKSTAVIADYYHIFSNIGTSTFAKLGRKIENAIIIVDEAHNLPQRVRNIASDRLSSFVIKGAAKEAKDFGFDGLVDVIQEIGNVLDEIGNKMLKEKNESLVKKEDFSNAISGKLGDISALHEDLLDAADHVRQDRKKSSLGSLAKFLRSWEGDEKGFARVIKKGITKSGKQYITLNYMCLDPRIFTSSIVEEAHSVILMSGTLEPHSMYRDLLGLAESRTMMKSYASPFPKNNRLCVIVNDVTTRYTKREENYEKIAQHVVNCSNSIPGNVAVFFPSYRFRDRIFEATRNAIEKEIITEQQGANKSDRRRIYDAFIANHEKGSVLFGVQAGSFSEGIDLPGKFLNGVIIVGVPLEMPNLETKALIEYYDEKFQRGWDYGYIYPAMMRSIQAAGRCIRSEKDRGACIFVDERFAWANYRKVLPQDWIIRASAAPQTAIKSFFDQA